AAASLVAGRAVGFGVLSGAQLAYTLNCRAAGTRPSPRFTALVGGTVALQAAALTLLPLRRLLSLGAGAAPLAGFAVGFALPWLLGRAGGSELIVRRGTAVSDGARPCIAAAQAPQP